MKINSYVVVDLEKIMLSDKRSSFKHYVITRIMNRHLRLNNTIILINLSENDKPNDLESIRHLFVGLYEDNENLHFLVIEK